jgi:carotenoid cleavage dioxygenase
MDRQREAPGHDLSQRTVNRRAFLRGTALLASGALAPWLLSACRSSSRPGAPRQTAVPLAVDPGRPWWLQNNFQPVTDELDVANLEVIGSIPSELNGVYVRNGSNPQDADNPHWFLGDGMLHGVRLENGQAVWYRNRYIQTELFTTGLGALDGGPPIGGSNNSNVSAVYHAGRLLTSGEVGFPYEIDPEDLSTIGVYDFSGMLNTSFTAHPKIDPATGWMHFFGYWFAPPFLTYHIADEAGRLVHSEEVVVSAPTMIHSFAITERDVVFWELPVLFDARGIEVHGFPYLWDASYGARIGIMPLGGPASAIRWVEIEPAYVFHELNAFREGDDVVIDVCRYESMMDGERFGSVSPRLHRWRVDTGGDALSFRDEVLEGKVYYEFPMHDRRQTGRSNQHGWFVEARTHPETIDLRGLAHVDHRAGTWRTWDPGHNLHCGEAFFVPGGSGEGEGWLLTVVYDDAQDASNLTILDALDIEKGPLAQILMPRRIPYGFHGVWIPRNEG